jgi:hypothetical protein
MPNGKVCLVPYNSPCVGIYDPVANTYANGPAHGYGVNVNAFYGAALLADGRVAMAPLTAARVGLYDPAANTYTDGPAKPPLESYTGCAALPDGRVAMIPYNTANIGLYHSGGTATLAACLSPYFNKL